MVHQAVGFGDRRTVVETLEQDDLVPRGDEPRSERPKEEAGPPCPFHFDRQLPDAVPGRQEKARVAGSADLDDHAADPEDVADRNFGFHQAFGGEILAARSEAWRRSDQSAEPLEVLARIDTKRAIRPAVMDRISVPVTRDPLAPNGRGESESGLDDPARNLAPRVAQAAERSGVDRDDATDHNGAWQD